MTAIESLRAYLGWVHGTTPPALEFRFEPSFPGRHQWFVHWKTEGGDHRIGTWAEDVEQSTEQIARHTLDWCRQYWEKHATVLKRALSTPPDPSLGALFHPNTPEDMAEMIDMAQKRVSKIDSLIAALNPP